MVDMLQNAMQWLEQMRTTHCTQEVLYRRGELAQPLAATPGRTLYEVEDEHGFRIGAQASDFLIAAKDFTALFEVPHAGDQIVFAQEVYEVMSLAGVGHWRWCDPYQQTLRIHTRVIGADT